MINTETKIESYRMWSIIVMYDMHTKFLHNAVEGITDSDATNRLGTAANHMSWLVGSLVQARYELAGQLDGLNDVKKEIEKPAAHELFRDGKGIDDKAVYPSLSIYLGDWVKISPVLRDILSDIDEHKLNKHFTKDGHSMSYFDLIAFNTYREANIIGQLALWRRLLGHEAMKYN